MKNWLKNATSTRSHYYAIKTGNFNTVNVTQYCVMLYKETQSQLKVSLAECLRFCFHEEKNDQTIEYCIQKRRKI